MERSRKTKETKEKIKNSALEIFREKGYEATTMRLIAQKAKVALGTIYIYYESKDDLILEYYTDIQENLRQKIKDSFNSSAGANNPHKKNLTELLSFFFISQIKAMQNDKNFLSGLIGAAATPQTGLSVFSESSQSVRTAHIAILREIIEQSDEKMDSQFKSKLPYLLWFMHMGFIFYWIHDNSKDSEHTYKLLQTLMSLLNSLLKLQNIPLPFSFKNQIIELIGQLMALENFT